MNKIQSINGIMKVFFSHLNSGVKATYRRNIIELLNITNHSARSVFTLSLEDLELYMAVINKQKNTGDKTKKTIIANISSFLNKANAAGYFQPHIKYKKILKPQSMTGNKAQMADDLTTLFPVKSTQHYTDYKLIEATKTEITSLTTEINILQSVIDSKDPFTVIQMRISTLDAWRKSKESLLKKLGWKD